MVARLRENGHEVYDFRHPAPGNTGFHWTEIDPFWQSWGPEQFRSALQHPVAVSGFGLDKAAMDWADTCVLVLPAGRSAHLEAGYMAGQGKRVVAWTNEPIEPELMYGLLGPLYVGVEPMGDIAPVGGQL